MVKKAKTTTFHYTSLAINILERLIDPTFNIHGLENLTKKPVLFVANHFTRFETFIVPYLIYKHTKRQVRCLADSSLFNGNLGRYLERAGTLSTKDSKRNETIISDLISGDYDWMIYPEGSMIKSKKIYFKDRFIAHTSDGSTRTKTGATVLALKSELYRQDLIRAFKDGDKNKLKFYQEKYQVTYSDALKDIDTHIIPVNITYYPIRPGNNIIKNVAQKLLKRLPKNITEELEIEGNLLLSSHINITFGKAIRVADYSRKIRSTVRHLPLLSEKTKHNLVINYLKYQLTDKFMKDIYSNTKINLDHLFSAVIFYFNGDKININHLKNIIYSSAIDIAKLNSYHLSHSIIEENLVKIFNSEKHPEFDSIVNLSLKLGILNKSSCGHFFMINRSNMEKEYDFHQVRIENTFQVIFNEFSLLNKANLVIKNNVSKNTSQLEQSVFTKIYQQDIKIFQDDYKKYYDSDLSKDQNIGQPFYLDKSKGINSDIGILLCHGYNSAPQEMADMAANLSNLGYKIYAVRLSGHGTAPQNMEDVKWHDWYDSFQRGYSALNIVCKKIVVVGFSTGGLLSLLASANKANSKIAGIVVINAALKLQDIRARFIVPGVNIWNDLINKLKLKKISMTYVQSNSENPKVNYPRNYLKAVKQLGILMKKCLDSLVEIKQPTLIIYSKDDPIVKPVSSKIIYNNISSNIKEIAEFKRDNHIIVVGKGSDEVFNKVAFFISDLFS